MTAGALAGLDPCVHCGFCLQACPTFLVTGDEADSPRGRIVLMQGLAAGRLDRDDPEVISHLDRCLGCRACEPVCPSGVRYGPALEQARQLLAQARPIPAAAMMVHAIMAERRLHRPLLALARMVRPFARWLAGESRVGFAFGMLAATRPGREWRQQQRGWRPSPRGNPSAPATPHARATLFRGCIMSGLFGHVHDATGRVLRANGYALLDVPEQGCCGALHAHAGQHETAAMLARHNVIAFRELPDNACIVVNSAGCGAMLREYGRLLADDPLAHEASRVAARSRDITEVLAEQGPRSGAALPLRVAYDPPCHLLHAQRIADAPAAVLAAVPDLDPVTHDEAELCCGNAGSYSLVQPELSQDVLLRKVTALRELAPDVVATGNPGCMMQIGAGLLASGDRVPVVHPVELLDWSYERAGYYVH